MLSIITRHAHVGFYPILLSTKPEPIRPCRFRNRPKSIGKWIEAVFFVKLGNDQLWFRFRSGSDFPGPIENQIRMLLKFQIKKIKKI